MTPGSRADRKAMIVLFAEAQGQVAVVHCLLFIVLIFGVMYFMMIRPQQRAAGRSRTCSPPWGSVTRSSPSVACTAR